VSATVQAPGLRVVSRPRAAAERLKSDKTPPRPLGGSGSRLPRAREEEKVIPPNGRSLPGRFPSLGRRRLPKTHEEGRQKEGIEGATRTSPPMTRALIPTMTTRLPTRRTPSLL